jgi:hypothetical protein
MIVLLLCGCPILHGLIVKGGSESVFREKKRLLCIFEARGTEAG